MIVDKSGRGKWKWSEEDEMMRVLTAIAIESFCFDLVLHKDVNEDYICVAIFYGEV